MKFLPWNGTLFSNVAENSSDPEFEKNLLLNELEEHLNSGLQSKPKLSQEDATHLYADRDKIYGQEALKLAILHGIDPRLMKPSIQLDSSIKPTTDLNTLDQQFLDNQFESFLNGLDSAELIDLLYGSDDGAESEIYSARDRIFNAKLPQNVFDPLLDIIKNSNPILHRSLTQLQIISGSQKSRRKLPKKERKRETKKDKDKTGNGVGMNKFRQRKEKFTAQTPDTSSNSEYEWKQLQELLGMVIAKALAENSMSSYLVTLALLLIVKNDARWKAHEPLHLPVANLFAAVFERNVVETANQKIIDDKYLIPNPFKMFLNTARQKRFKSVSNDSNDDMYSVDGSHDNVSQLGGGMGYQGPSSDAGSSTMGSTFAELGTETASVVGEEPTEEELLAQALALSMSDGANALIPSSLMTNNVVKTELFSPSQRVSPTSNELSANDPSIQYPDEIKPLSTSNEPTVIRSEGKSFNIQSVPIPNHFPTVNPMCTFGPFCSVDFWKKLTFYEDHDSVNSNEPSNTFIPILHIIVTLLTVLSGSVDKVLNEDSAIVMENLGDDEEDNTQDDEVDPKYLAEIDSNYSPSKASLRQETMMKSEEQSNAKSQSKNRPSDQRLSPTCNLNVPVFPSHPSFFLIELILNLLQNELVNLCSLHDTYRDEISIKGQVTSTNQLLPEKIISVVGEDSNWQLNFYAMIWCMISMLKVLRCNLQVTVQSQIPIGTLGLINVLNKFDELQPDAQSGLKESINSGGTISSVSSNQELTISSVVGQSDGYLPFVMKLMHRISECAGFVKISYLGPTIATGHSNARTGTERIDKVLDRLSSIAVLSQSSNPLSTKPQPEVRTDIKRDGKFETATRPNDSTQISTFVDKVKYFRHYLQLSAVDTYVEGLNVFYPNFQKRAAMLAKLIEKTPSPSQLLIPSAATANEHASRSNLVTSESIAIISWYETFETPERYSWSLSSLSNLNAFSMLPVGLYEVYLLQKVCQKILNYDDHLKFSAVNCGSSLIGYPRYGDPNPISPYSFSSNSSAKKQSNDEDYLPLDDTSIIPDVYRTIQDMLLVRLGHPYLACDFSTFQVESQPIQRVLKRMDSRHSMVVKMTEIVKRRKDRSNEDFFSFSLFGGELKFLRAIQQARMNQFLLSTNHSGGNPTRCFPLSYSGSVGFNSSRCHPNLIISNEDCNVVFHLGPKLWATVVSVRGFEPNTGIYEWAIRIDRCGKGHVFLGVVTSESTTDKDSYVGVDKYGWGLIGTRSLWHNKAKVVSEYGTGFGTSSIVVARMDTDQGKLSFRTNESDWGVAFENIPKQVIYPAYSLHERDDQLTLLFCYPLPRPSSTPPIKSVGPEVLNTTSSPPSVELDAFINNSATVSMNENESTTGKRPRIFGSLNTGSHEDEAKLIHQSQHDARVENEMVNFIQTLFSQLNRIFAAADFIIKKEFNNQNEEISDRYYVNVDGILSHPLIGGSLSSVAALFASHSFAPSSLKRSTLCFSPYFLIIAKKLASICEFLNSKKYLNEHLSSKDSAHTGDSVTGTWLLRCSAINSLNFPVQEYKIHLLANATSTTTGQDALQDEKTGKMASNLLRIEGIGSNATGSTVSIIGTKFGNRVRFLENWVSVYSVIDCRLSLCETYMYGRYKDVKSGKLGYLDAVRLNTPSVLKQSYSAIMKNVLMKCCWLSTFACSKLSASLVMSSASTESLFYHLNSVHQVSKSAIPLQNSNLLSSVKTSLINSSLLKSNRDDVLTDADPASENQITDSQPPEVEPTMPYSDNEPIIPNAPNTSLINLVDEETNSSNNSDEAIIKYWIQSNLFSGGLVLNQNIQSLLLDYLANYITLPSAETDPSLDRPVKLKSSGPPYANLSIKHDTSVGHFDSNSEESIHHEELLLWWLRKVFSIASLDLAAAYQSERKFELAGEQHPLNQTPQSLQNNNQTENNFYNSIVKNSKEFGFFILDDYILLYSGQPILLKIGGEVMQFGRRYVLASIIKHSGCASMCMKEISLIQTGRRDISSRPNPILLDIWRAAQRVIERTVQLKQETGSSYGNLSNSLCKKADLLLNTIPSRLCQVVAQTIRVHSDFENYPQQGIPAISENPFSNSGAVTEAFLNLQQDISMIISDTVEFLISPLKNTQSLRQEMLKNLFACMVRIAGFRSFSMLMGAINDAPTWTGTQLPSLNSSLWLQSTVTNQVLHSMRELYRADDTNVFDKVISHSPSMAAHYKDNLFAITNEWWHELKLSFESVYENVTQSLGRSTWNEDRDCQMISLTAWGIIIQPDDHVFLNRIGLFRILQTVLDDARSSISKLFSTSNFDYLQKTPSGDFSNIEMDLFQRFKDHEYGIFGCDMLMNSHRKLAQLVLCVVHGLASQVASGKDTTSSILGKVSLTIAPRLQKSQSGPDTLSKSLFDLMYSELFFAFKSLLSEAEKALKLIVNDDDAMKQTNVSNIQSNSQTDEFLGGEMYVYRILRLLYLVSSGSKICQRILTSPKWLSLLMCTIGYTGLGVQRRILRLVRGLLINSEPQSLNAHAPNLYTERDNLPFSSESAPDEEEWIELSKERSYVIDGYSEKSNYTELSDQKLEFSKRAIRFLLECVSIIYPIDHQELIETDILPIKGREKALMILLNNKGALDSLSADALMVIRVLQGNPAWRDLINQVTSEILNQFLATVSGKGDEKIQRSFAMAALAVNGGYLERIRLGGMVFLKPMSISTNTEAFSNRLASVTHSCGMIVSHSAATSSVEIVLMEKGLKMIPGATIVPGSLETTAYPINSQPSTNRDLEVHHTTSVLHSPNPIRPARFNSNDVHACSDIPVVSSLLGSDNLNHLQQLLNSQSIPWVLSKLNKKSVESVTLNPQSSVPDDEMSQNSQQLLPNSEKNQVSDDEMCPGTDLPVKKLDNINVPEMLSTLTHIFTFRCLACALECPENVENFLSSFGDFETLLLSSNTPTTYGSLNDIENLEELFSIMSSAFFQLTLKPLHQLISLNNRTDSAADARDDDASNINKAASNQDMTHADYRSGRNDQGNSSPLRELNAILSPFGIGGATSAGNVRAPDTAAQSAALAQMLEMGLPKEWCEYALRRCQYNVEMAINLCLEHGADMSQLIAEEFLISSTTAPMIASRSAVSGSEQNSSNSLRKHTRELLIGRAAAALSGGGGLGRSWNRRQQSSDDVPSSYPAVSGDSNLLIRQLLDMGFPPSWCIRAMASTNNDLDSALGWILNHHDDDNMQQIPEGVTYPDFGDKSNIAETIAADNSTDTEEVENNPLCLVSGYCDIKQDLTCTTSMQGFPSVGCRGFAVSSGKWYYELTLITAGCIQVGWADTGYEGGADSGQGVGDDVHSWAFDGWRTLLWHEMSIEWGSKWSAGDVIGCAVDIDNDLMSFFLNGHGEDVGMGEAFASFSFPIGHGGGVYPCASFNRNEQIRFNFGSQKFRHSLPAGGYKPYIEHVSAVQAEVMVRLDQLNYTAINNKFIARGGQSKMKANRKRTELSLDDGLEQYVGEKMFHWYRRYFPIDDQKSIGSNHSDQFPHASILNTKTRLNAELLLSELNTVGLDLCILYSRLAILKSFRCAQTSQKIAKLLIDRTTTILANTQASLMISNEGTQINEQDKSLNIHWHKVFRLIKLSCLHTPRTSTYLMAKTIMNPGSAIPVNFGSIYSVGGFPLLNELKPAFLRILLFGLAHNNDDTQINFFLSEAISMAHKVASRDYAKYWRMKDEFAPVLQLDHGIVTEVNNDVTTTQPSVHYLVWITTILMELFASLLKSDDELFEGGTSSMLVEEDSLTVTSYTGKRRNDKNYLLESGISPQVRTDDGQDNSTRHSTHYADRIYRWFESLLQTWKITLRSPSMAVKTCSFRVMTTIVNEMSDLYLTIRDDSNTVPKFSVLSLFDEKFINRLMQLSIGRIQREREASPVYSEFLQACVEFVTLVVNINSISFMKLRVADVAGENHTSMVINPSEVKRSKSTADLLMLDEQEKKRKKREDSNSVDFSTDEQPNESANQKLISSNEESHESSDIDHTNKCVFLLTEESIPDQASDAFDWESISGRSLMDDFDYIGSWQTWSGSVKYYPIPLKLKTNQTLSGSMLDRQNFPPELLPGNKVVRKRTGIKEISRKPRSSSVDQKRSASMDSTNLSREPSDSIDNYESSFMTPNVGTSGNGRFPQLQPSARNSLSANTPQSSNQIPSVGDSIGRLKRIFERSTTSNIPTSTPDLSTPNNNSNSAAQSTSQSQGFGRLLQILQQDAYQGEPTRLDSLRQSLRQSNSRNDATSPSISESPPYLSSPRDTLNDASNFISGENSEFIDDDEQIGTVIEVTKWDTNDFDSFGLFKNIANARLVIWDDDETKTPELVKWDTVNGVYDVAHIKINKSKEKAGKASTSPRADALSTPQRFPNPPSKMQLLAHNSFGQEHTMGIILRIRELSNNGSTPNDEMMCSMPPRKLVGMVEWPYFHAVIAVTGTISSENEYVLKEESILLGTPHSGWEIRFGKPQWTPGTTFSLKPVSVSFNDTSDPSNAMLMGNVSFTVPTANNLAINGEVQLQRQRLFHFDRKLKAQHIILSVDKLSVSRSSHGGSGGCAFGSVGFSTGVHFWEFKIEQADAGSIFLGISELPPDVRTNKFTKWTGLGYINNRSSYRSSTDRVSVYGDHFQTGDLVGVLLDMNRGRLSFYLDGIKFGEHIIADLGEAYDSLVSANSVRPKVYYPIVGLNKSMDRVTITPRWLSSIGTSSRDEFELYGKAWKLLNSWSIPRCLDRKALPLEEHMWIYRAAWRDWIRWRSGKFLRVRIRCKTLCPSMLPMHIMINTTPWACIQASIKLGLSTALFSGDHIVFSKSSGRVLDQREEAVVLGAFNGLLWYKLDVQQQNSESNIMESSSLAWCMLPNDVEGMTLRRRRPQENGGVPATVAELLLPRIPLFRGGLVHLFHETGAVVREGLEIDTSEVLCTIPANMVIYAIEKRVNASNITRYRVLYDGHYGWISERMRGGAEEVMLQELAYIPSNFDEINKAMELVIKDANKAGITDRIRWVEASSMKESMELWSKMLYDHHLGYLVDDGGPLSANPKPLSSFPSQFHQDFHLNDESFEHFLSLTSTIDGNNSWSIEADMQLSDLISRCAVKDGVLPQNLSHLSIEKALCLTFDEYFQTKNGSSTSGLRMLFRDSTTSSSTQKQQQYFESCNRVIARASILRVANQVISHALPLVKLSVPDEQLEVDALGCEKDITVLCTQYPALKSVMKGNTDSDVDIQQNAIKMDQNDENDTKFAQQIVGRGEDVQAWTPLCIGRTVRKLRRLLFSQTKTMYWDAIMEQTNTVTPLPPDEYEDPKEVKSLRINRVKATQTRLASISNPAERLKQSVFGQMHKEMRGWPNNAFRRSYIGKGHGGQKRAFKVKFIGEGVNDYGGPYRAIFEQIVDELQCDTLTVGGQKTADRCLLPLLVPSANRLSSIGANQDKFIFSSVPHPSPLNQELMQFFGKIVGMAVRHNLNLALDLSWLVWRPLVHLPVSRNHLESVDSLLCSNLREISKTGFSHEFEQEAKRKKSYHEDAGLIQLGNKKSSDLHSNQLLTGGAPEEMDSTSFQPEEWIDLNFTAYLSDGSKVPLVLGGQDLQVNLSNWRSYIMLMERSRLTESAAMFKVFKDGLSSVLPIELFPLFTAQELEHLISGNSQVDINLIRKCTEYENLSPNSELVNNFWEVLQEMSNEEKTQFLRFVWARSRMPVSSQDLPMNFKLQCSAVTGKDANHDNYLPHAQTCFFSLSIPKYSNKEIMREKILYAIKNSPNMDADVRLHSAEGWADS